MANPPAAKKTKAPKPPKAKNFNDGELLRVPYEPGGQTQCPRCRHLNRPAHQKRTSVYCTRGPIRYMTCYLCTGELGRNYSFQAIDNDEAHAHAARARVDALHEAELSAHAAREIHALKRNAFKTALAQYRDARTKAKAAAEKLARLLNQNKKEPNP